MKHLSIHLPSIRCLKAFEASARLESFSAAARELHTSQSSISRHVCELEAILGSPLFERRKQRVCLTEQGKQLQRRVGQGLDTILDGLLQVVNWDADVPVTIGCTHAISHLLIMPVFEALQSAMSDFGTDTTGNVTGLPTGGHTVYVTLYYKINGVWNSSTSLPYTAAMTGEPIPILQTSLPDQSPPTALTGAVQNFNWSVSAYLDPITQWVLFAGSTALGTDYFIGSFGTATSGAVTGLPQAGRMFTLPCGGKVVASG